MLCALGESKISVACWVYAPFLFFSLLGSDLAMLLRAPCCVCVVWSSSPTNRGEVCMDVSERAGSAYSPCSLHAFRYTHHTNHN